MNWWFWTVVLEKTLESPLDSKETQPVHPKGNQSWIFIGRTDAEVETPILWYLMWRADSFEKTLMLGKIEGGRRRGQQRMRWVDGITNLISMSLSKTPRVGDGQGGLACWSQWGCKESDTTEQLNWIELNRKRRKRLHLGGFLKFSSYKAFHFLYSVHPHSESHVFIHSSIHSSILFLFIVIQDGAWEYRCF